MLGTQQVEHFSQPASKTETHLTLLVEIQLVAFQSWFHPK